MTDAIRQELEAMIAEQKASIAGRRQLAETESLPAIRAQKARAGRPALRAMPADPQHGERHRHISEIEERRLAALQAALTAVVERDALRQQLSEAQAALNEVDADTAAVNDACDQLFAERGRLREALFFFASVGRSAEAWTEHCDAALSRATAPLAPTPTSVPASSRLGDEPSTKDAEIVRLTEELAKRDSPAHYTDQLQRLEELRAAMTAPPEARTDGQ